MRLLFVADGRSPIAQNWIRYFSERGDEVHLASTFACLPDFRLDGFKVTPVAFSGRAKRSMDMSRASARTLRARATIRHWIGPFTIRRSSASLREMIERVKPNLVHAMRIPYEGMLAADAYAGVPLVVSVWGNDFTLHAPSNALMRHYTSWTMQVAHGLHADCQRDIRLAKQWGFEPELPTLVAPGNGGIRGEIFHAPPTAVTEPVVINPRGFRTYVRSDVFFQAIPRVLSRVPDARFICIAMAGERQAIEWIRELGIERSVELLPTIPHPSMGDVLRRGQVVVSLATHDGTPNTLLEAMACGCFPVAGDLDSIREWITPGENGLLTDVTNPSSVAAGILDALEKKNLRHQAAGINQAMIAQRAEYARCMATASSFYERVVAA
jgi:glycosyltransferase involved in cell wall biosynthesis